MLTAAGKRLGVRIPKALRDYFLVAGRERRFGTCNNRLLPPSQWTTDKHRLIFMEENQRVVWWGVSTRNPHADDPPVSRGLNEEPITWQPDHRKCSAFLAFMLHYQAVSGGFDHSGRADAPEETDYRFEEHGWTCHGKLSGMSAYSRRNQVVCLVPPGDLPFLRKWSVLAGGKTRADLQAIEADLGIRVD